MGLKLARIKYFEFNLRFPNNLRVMNNDAVIN